MVLVALLSVVVATVPWRRLRRGLHLEVLVPARSGRLADGMREKWWRASTALRRPGRARGGLPPT